MFLLLCSLVVFLALASSIFFYRLKHQKFYEHYEKIPPADGALPLYKLGWKFITADSEKSYKKLSLVTASGSSPRRLSFGPLCYVLVDDPDQVQVILNSRSCINKTSSYKKLPLKSGEPKAT
jgi:hypothetical protein